MTSPTSSESSSWGRDPHIAEFLEKPPLDQTQGLHDDPDSILASMGNYVFTTDTLVELLHENENAEATGHDVGGDLIPMMVARGEASVYDFTQNRVPGQIGRPHYWRDVGTIDSYYEAHMDLVGHDPAFDLYNSEWPIYTSGRTLPPAKIDDHGDYGPSDLRRSIISNGAIVVGAKVADSVLSPDVAVGAGAVVERSVLLDGVKIGEGAQVRGVVIDKNVVVPPGVTLGHDLEHDREHYTVSEGGVVVLAKAQPVVG